MKIKKVNRYYCEYCKKSGCSAGHMVKHEKHCTMNPNRICRMCEIVSCNSAMKKPISISILKKLFPNPKEYVIEDEYGWISYLDEFGIKVEKAMIKLREFTNNCPACILAVLRQCGIPVPFVKSFNYKKECAQMWADYNDQEYKKQEMANYY